MAICIAFISREEGRGKGVAVGFTPNSAHSSLLIAREKKGRKEGGERGGKMKSRGLDALRVMALVSI